MTPLQPPTLDREPEEVPIEEWDQHIEEFERWIEGRVNDMNRYAMLRSKDNLIDTERKWLAEYEAMFADN